MYLYYYKRWNSEHTYFWVNCMTSHAFQEIKASYKYFIFFFRLSTTIIIKSIKRPPGRSINFFQTRLWDKGGFLRWRDVVVHFSWNVSHPTVNYLTMYTICYNVVRITIHRMFSIFNVLVLFLTFFHTLHVLSTGTAVTAVYKFDKRRLYSVFFSVPHRSSIFSN